MFLICFVVTNVCVISGFRRHVNGISRLSGFHAAQISSVLPTLGDNLSILSPMVKPSSENGTDKLSRNVGKKLSLYTAYIPDREKLSSA